MINIEIIIVVTSKEKGRKTGLGRGLTDGFNCIYNIYIGGRGKSKENKAIYKTEVCPIIFSF